MNLYSFVLTPDSEGGYYVKWNLTIPLILTPRAEGGYTATCPWIPDLVAEGQTTYEALSNFNYAWAAMSSVAQVGQ